MDNKEMAQIFSDIIAVSQAPVIVNGEIYKEHKGAVNLTYKAIEAILFAQRELRCKDVQFGSYDCYESTMHGFDVDGCLVGEINYLNNSGITTIGCCCGHGKADGYIQVSPFYIEKMKELGYEELLIDENGNGEWCFKPKTLLPKESGIGINNFINSITGKKLNCTF